MITPIFTVIAFGMYTVFLCYGWIDKMIFIDEGIESDLISLSVFWWILLIILSNTAWA